MKIYIPLICLLVMFIQSCNTTEPPTPSQNEQPKDIKLKLLDVSCTEAFINVSAFDSVLPVSIVLNKDDAALFNFTLTKTDTTLIDTTLQAGKTYVFQTTAVINSVEQKSDTLQVKTLNTTSNNYTWQKFYFGNGASSTLYDLAIIDENNIWCVGVININDSSQNGFTTYNAVHWDGSQWELKKISVIYNGNLITPQLYGIYAFSSTDIWLSSGVPVHGDGVNWTQYHLFDMGILGQNDGYLTKIWGTSSSNIYYVGTLGTIAHYQNGQWIKIESGTNLNIHDINGFTNPVIGKTEILCVADDPNYQQGVQVISINEDNTTELLDNNGLGIAISSVWFVPGIQYYIVGNGLYQKTHKEATKWIDLNNYRKITQNYMVSIRGTGLNNIIVTGAFGEVIHFNGLRWESLRDQTFLDNGTYSSVAIKGNLVIAVGQDQNQGVILVGHQQL